MSKVLAVFGATGQQGSSVIEYVLNDPELSIQYQLRAITRDASSSKAQYLRSKNVEVVAGDVTDWSSLVTALTNVHTIFAMTPGAFGPDALDNEYNQAKTIADVALEQGVSYIIFSTLPPVHKISNGKYTSLTAFDAKAKAEAYIRSLPIQSAFYCPGSFMENFLGMSALVPQQASDGIWVLARHVKPTTQFPLIDATSDTGKFVGAILADPSKYEGKRICAATKLYSMDEMTSIMAKVTGQKVIYEQITLEESTKDLQNCFPASLAGFIEIVNELLNYQEEFGYFGAGTQESVDLAVESARGKLTSFEDFLRTHNFRLEYV